MAIDLFSSPPSCVSNDPGSWCAQVWNSTHLDLAGRPDQLGLAGRQAVQDRVIGVIALVVRILMHRMIRG